MNDVFFLVENATGRKFSYYCKRRGIYLDTFHSQGACTRAMNKHDLHKTHSPVHAIDYKPVMVERTNLMSGLSYMEDINTPGYCSPASESYWSL